MAQYSLSHSSIGRTNHKPGAAAAHGRYILRERAVAEILARLPADVAPTRLGVSAWLNAEERRERKNGRVIDKIMVALPIELTAEQQAEALRSFCDEITRGEAPYVAAIHRDHANNPHAHIIVRDRRLSDDKKFLRWNERETHATQMLRDQWETVANKALERAGHDQRIDKRTNAARGIDRIAGIHLGPAHGMQKRGIPTDRGDLNETILRVNAERALAEAEAIARAAAEDLARLEAQRDREEAAREPDVEIRNERVDWRAWREDLLSGHYEADLRGSDLARYWFVRRTEDGLELRNKNGAVADRGTYIRVSRASTPAIDAALSLAELRGWSSFKISGGSREHVEIMIREALARGFHVRVEPEHAELLAALEDDAARACGAFVPTGRVVAAADIGSIRLVDKAIAGISSDGRTVYVMIGRDDVLAVDREEFLGRRLRAGQRVSLRVDDGKVRVDVRPPAPAMAQGQTRDRGEAEIE